MKHTEAMQLIVQASPETIELCHAEGARLATTGDVCTKPIPLLAVDEIKYQDFMSKVMKNHVFGTKEDDDWTQDLQLINGTINPSGGNPIPLIEIPGDPDSTG